MPRRFQIQAKTEPAYVPPPSMGWFVEFSKPVIRAAGILAAASLIASGAVMTEIDHNCVTQGFPNAGNNGAGAATVTISNFSCPEKSLLLLAINSRIGQSVSEISYGGLTLTGGDWQAVGGFSGTSSELNVYVAYAPSAVTPQTLTVTFTGSVPASISIQSFQNTNATTGNPTRGVYINSVNWNSYDTTSPGTMTMNGIHPRSLVAVVHGVGDTTATTYTAGSGYRSLAQSSGTGISAFIQAQNFSSQGGTETPTWSWTPNTTVMSFGFEILCNISFDSWYRPFSEPVRRPRLVLNTDMSVEPIQVSSVPDFGWFQPLSSPQVKRPALYAYYPSDAETGGATSTVSMDWFQPFSRPIRRALTVPNVDMAVEPIAQPVVVVPDFGWFVPLSQPLPGLLDLYSYEIIGESVEGQTGTGVNIDWFVPFSRPVNDPKIPAEYWSDGFSAGPITGWYMPLSTPVRSRPRAPWTQFVIDPKPTAAAQAPDFGWFQSLSLPRPLARSLYCYMEPAAGGPTLTGTGTNIDWLVPFSQPVLDRLLAVEYHSVGFSGGPVLGWRMPFSEPVRAKGPHPSRMPSTFLNPFQASTPEVVTMDKWFQPFSRPVNDPTALVPQGQFVTDTDPVVASMDWFQKFSEPVRRKTLPLDQFVTDLDPVVSFGWMAPLSEPARRKVAAPWTQYAIDPYALTQPETTTLDRYWHNFSRPTQRKPQAPVGFIASGQPDISFDWFEPLSEPVRRKVPAAPSQFAYAPEFTGNEVVTLDKWFQPFSVPVLRKGFAPWTQFAVDPKALTQPETTTVDRYWHNFSRPVLRPVRPPVGFIAFGQTDLAFDWFRPFPDPVRRKPFINEGGEFLTPSFSGTEVVTLDKWFQPLSVPVRPLVRAPWTQQVVDPFILTQPEATTVDRYWQNFSTPVRRKPQAAEGQFAFNTTEIVTLDKWFRPLSEPVRRKPQAAEGRIAYAPEYTGTEVVTVDKWFQPLSVPVRPPARVAHTQFTIDPYALTQPEVTTVDRWHQPLSLPVRRPAQAVPGAFASGKPDLAFDWFAPFSEPVRRRPVGRAELSSPVTVPEVVTMDKWFRPLSEPVMVAKRVAWSQFVVDPKALTQPEVTTLDRYWKQWADPVRRIRPTPQQALAFSPTVIVPDLSWLVPFSVPVRRLVPAPASQMVADTNQRIQLGWLVPLSVPTLRKKSAPLATGFTQTFIPIAPEVVTMDKWYAPFSMPRWDRARLDPSRQPSVFADTTTPPPAAPAPYDDTPHIGLRQQAGIGSGANIGGGF